jgi:hypothetical protein
MLFSLAAAVVGAEPGTYKFTLSPDNAAFTKYLSTVIPLKNWAN